jgi:peptide/nickel transport system substrate-binding protein
MPEDDKELDFSHLARRDMLRAGMAASIPVALAGCSGGGDDTTTAPGGGDDTTTAPGGDGDGGSDGDGGGTSTDVETPDERVDTRLTVSHQDSAGPIPQLNWNVYSPGGYPWGGRSIGRVSHVEFSVYSPQTGEEYFVLGDSWEMVDDTTVELTLKDDIQWHDGTEITTQDIAVEERINDALIEITGDAAGGGQGLTPSEFVSGWNVIDDKTWQYELTDAYTEGFVQERIVKGDIEVKADVYEPFAEEMENLLEDGDTEGAEEAAQDLLEHTIPNEEMYGNGPFQYKNHTDTTFILEVNEDYVYADNTFFTEFAFQEFESREEAFISGGTDVYHGSLTDEQESRAPEFHQLGTDRISERGVHMNLGLYDQASDFSEAVEGAYEPVTRDPEGWLVRKAIAYALDPEQLATAMDEDADPVVRPQSNYPVTMYHNNPGPIESSWLDENLENYGEQQPDKAEEMLEAAGMDYSEDEGTWLDWDGEPVEITVLSPSDPAEEQVIQQHLQDLGFNVTLSASENFGSDRWQGRFDLMPDSGTGTSSSVFDSFPKSDWHAGMYHGPTGINDDYGWPVPTPIGNTDVTDPDEREFYVQGESYNEYLTSGDTAALKEMMWASNQFLPTYDFARFSNGSIVNAERWEIEGPSGLLDSGARASYYNLIKHEAASIVPREDS